MKKIKKTINEKIEFFKKEKDKIYFDAEFMIKNIYIIAGVSFIGFLNFKNKITTDTGEKIVIFLFLGMSLYYVLKIYFYSFFQIGVEDEEEESCIEIIY